MELEVEGGCTITLEADDSNPGEMPVHRRE